MKKRLLFSAELADRVRASREAKGFTFRKMAEVLGTNLASAQRIEEGKIVSAARKLKVALARFCSIQPQELERIFKEAQPPVDITSDQDLTPIIRLLTGPDTGVERVTLDEVRYLMLLFAREKWVFPTDPGALVFILDLYRKRRSRV